MKKIVYWITAVLLIWLTIGTAELIQVQASQARFDRRPELAGSQIHNEKLTGLETPNTPETQFQITVVKVYFSDSQTIREIASWIEPWEVHQHEKYLVVGVDKAQFERLKASGYTLEIDLEKTLQYNRPHLVLPGQSSGIPEFPCYRTLSETYASALALTNANPSLAEWIDIGDSWEKSTGDGGEDLFVLRLTNKANGWKKPVLFLMASMHAREYAPAELALRFAEYLLQSYGTDPDATWILDHQEIHLLLQANPDGRKLAELGTNTYHTWWRKNTNLEYCASDPFHIGADLNRNFDFQWGCCGGSSPFECDDIFRGNSPGSEPETVAIQSYLRSIFADQRGSGLTDPAPTDTSGLFIDLHSYGQLVLWPWGFTPSPSPNDAALRLLGEKFAAINGYNPAQSYELYPTDGTTDDFAYGDLGLSSYTFEIGTQFFESCQAFEQAILPDNIPALIYAAQVSRMPYGLPAGPDVLEVNIHPSTYLPDAHFDISALIDADPRSSRIDRPDENSLLPIIDGAEFTIDIPYWITTTLPQTYTLFPVDGAFDEPVEWVAGSIERGNLGSGRHMVYLRGLNAEGVWGPVSAGFLNLEQYLQFFPWVVK